ncbi:unnamed protein product, partial [Bubo scandiacus]
TIPQCMSVVPSQQKMQVLLGACFSASRSISSPLSSACALCSIVPQLQKTLLFLTLYKSMVRNIDARKA